jgi:2-iminoacetate synthase
MMFALRICFPDSEIVISTRELATFRDNMAGICITRMSAGSKTNPGGYGQKDDSLSQFEVADERTPAEIFSMLKSKNLEAVWKDWDKAFTK